MQRNYDHIFKIILIGSSSVGKTSILRRYAQNEFSQTFLSTIGIDFRFRSFYLDDKYIKLQIWDTAGQQRFKNITKSYYHGSHAIIIVYDASDDKSFYEVQNWLQQAIQFCQSKQIYCIANKCDIKSKSYINKQQEKFCDLNGIKIFPVSAKTGQNIHQTFQIITKQLMMTHPPIENSAIRLEINQKQIKKQKSCKC